MYGGLRKPRIEDRKGLPNETPHSTDERYVVLLHQDVDQLRLRVFPQGCLFGLGGGEPMRRAAKVDDNHDEIVQALKTCGAIVQSLAAIGKGCPDLLCAFRGRLFLLEVKDGSKPPSRQRLTDDQLSWHRSWGTLVDVVNSPEQALRAIGAIL